MNILLTAFEPFGGKNKNSSAEALKALRDFEGVKKIFFPLYSETVLKKFTKK